MGKRWKIFQVKFKENLVCYFRFHKKKYIYRYNINHSLETQPQLKLDSNKIQFQFNRLFHLELLEAHGLTSK